MNNLIKIRFLLVMDQIERMMKNDKSYLYFPCNKDYASLNPTNEVINCPLSNTFGSNCSKFRELFIDKYRNPDYIQRGKKGGCCNTIYKTLLGIKKELEIED